MVDLIITGFASAVIGFILAVLAFALLNVIGRD
jgi:hypothetical protein